VSVVGALTVFFICGFGFVLAAGIVGTIVYDLIAIRKDWRTVSEETYRLGLKFPSLAVAASGVLGMAVGILIGHLWLGQIIEVVVK
jgi:hypothetical protein